MLQNEWSYAEDRQPATSRLRKDWLTDSGSMLQWRMEVRSENLGAGTVRFREIVVKGSLLGELMLSIENKDDRA